jgi:membrane protein insertase Oxa1/YidC/SpoIIIJ
MNFTDSISSILFNGSNWANGSAWTALVLFILMSGAQVVSMLLPQWMQKRKQKKVAKLGKNPAQTQQNRTMKIVTYVMMIMIIFMGFTLASAMGVYWFIGALISILQTLVTQAIISHQSKEKR